MILSKKMLRDLKEQKGSLFALCMIIASGMCLYVSMFMVSDSLFRAIDQYYAEYHFGDVFATVVSIPEAKREELEAIDGIDKVTIRYTRDVRVLFEENEENVFVRLISYDAGNTDDLNIPYLFEGIPIRANDGGVYISPAFAEANKLKEGDLLPILLNGSRKEFFIAGIAQSPEYVYAISGKDDIFPNAALFGAVMVPEEMMNQMFQTGGLGNSISCSLEDGYQFTDVESVLKGALKSYGLNELVERKNQISHFMLMAEADQLKNMGNSLPLMMIMISSVILIITLRRRVEGQRGQIGIMLAFGYTRREILSHYLFFGLFVGIAGGIIGNLLGIAILNGLVQLYKVYFHLPDFNADISVRYLLYGSLLAVGSSVLASVYGCREIIKLRPIEAMRPTVPMKVKPSVFENIQAIWKLFTIPGKMAVRNMTRAPFRSAVSLLGTGFVFALMAVVFAFNNMMDLMIVNQYETIEVYDVKVNFSAYAPENHVSNELMRYDGVKLAETMLEIPCTLRNKNFKADTTVIGLSEESSLYQIYDIKNNKIKMKPGEAVLSKNLADKLSVSSGSIIYMDISFLEAPIAIQISKVIPQYLGANLYLEKETLQYITGEGGIVSSAMLLAEPEAVSAIKKEYRLAEQIRGISRPDDMFKMVTDYLDTYRIMIYVMGIAVSLIGFVIVYNSAIISFSERSRELASLMVLGLTKREVVQVISFEQWVLSMAGTVIGIPLSLLLNKMFASTLQSDVYAMPEQVPVSAMVLAFVMTCVYLYLAQMRIYKKAGELVMVEVLKERE